MTHEETPEYNRNNPFMATLVTRYPLTKPYSHKITQHMELDLRGSGFTYKTGDSIGIYAVNDPALVMRLLQRLQATGDEEVITKKGETLPFSEWLSSRANINRCSKKMVSLLHERQSKAAPKASLERLLAPEGQAELKEFLDAREVWDLLEEYPEVAIEPQELCDLVGPLLPRFYSIASSAVVHPEQVHLTVALTQYVTNGHVRCGVCSHYLCHLAPLNMPVVPVYLQPSKDFTLPADHTAPLIMVGPGTGVAPYRGFMQERISVGATGANWLFFGDWNRASDFFYEDYWNHLAAEGRLRLSLAFSRDQAEKVYVQHRLLENAAEVYRWLEEGAYFYVCGDAENMAKGVDQALHMIVAEQSGQGADAAKAYIKALRESGRYLRDVY